MASTAEPADPLRLAEATATERRPIEPMRPAPVRVRCRRAVTEDAEALAVLLARRFPTRSRAYWDRALDRLAHHNDAQGYAHLGYVLQAGETIVGALLTILTRREEPEGGKGTDGVLRCNLSSWCVEDAFRSYSPLLVNAATRDKTATYVNISSERATRVTIEAQGFSRYGEGLFLAVPLLARRGAARVSDGSLPAPAGASASDIVMMRDHAGYGCLTFWCETQGRPTPLILAPWRPKRLLPTAHLIHGPETALLAAAIRAVAPSLARRGFFLVSFDAPARPPGLVGRHLPHAMPRYAKGAHLPRPGDLAYTEWPMFGA